MSAGISDGALIVDTGLNNAGFFRDARQFKQAVESLKNAVNRVGKDMDKSGAGYARTIQNNLRANREFNAELKKTEAEAQRLKASMDALAEKKLATDALQKNRAEVQKLSDEWRKLKDKRDQAMLMDNSKGVAAYEIQMEQVMQKVRALRVEREKLFADGNAFVSGKDTETYRTLAGQYAEITSRLREMRATSEEMGSGFAIAMRSVGKNVSTLAKMAGTGALSYIKKLAAGAKNAAIQLAKLAGRAVVSGLKKIGNLAGRAAQKLLHLGHAGKRSGGGLSISLKNLLRYGLGIRSLFALFNRLRSAIKEGFETLSASDPRLRASLASLSASLNGLKGSLAGAFAPILTACAPALNTLINLLTTAVNALGMFFAALTGQSYYNAAKGISSIGKAASGSSSSVKELKRQLAGFDELNILSDTSGGGGGSGAGASGAFEFEQAPIASGIRGFVDELKQLFAAGEYEEIGHVIADGINSAISSVQRFIRWDNIGPAVTRGVNSITGAINGLFDGVDWANLGATFGDGLNTLTNALLLWYQGINWGNIGHSLAEGLNGLVKRIDWRNIGDMLQAKLKALFDFTRNFVVTFDEIEFAKGIRRALGRIDWVGLATDFWDTAKIAFAKAGNFVKVLLGGDVYDVAGDAVEQMWERGSGGASSETYATSWVKILTQKIGHLLGSIPWPEILETVRHAFLDAFDGLMEGLFNSENGDVVLKIAAAIAGLKIGPKIIAAISSSVLGGGSGVGVGSARGILGALGFTGVAGAAAGQMAWNSFKANHQDVIDEVGNALLKFVENRKLDPNKKYEGTGNALADVGAWLLGGKEALDKIEASGSKLLKIAADFEKNGGDVIGWNKLFNAKEPGKAEINRETNERFKFEMDGGDWEGWNALFNDNTKALDKNTKATAKQTRTITQPSSVAEARAATSTVGVNLRALFNLRNDWQNALNELGDANIAVPINFLPAGVSSYINKPLEYLKKVFAPGTDAQTRVELVKRGWSTLAAFVGTGNTLSAMVALAKKGWTNLGSFVGTNSALSAIIHLAKGGWSTLSAFVGTTSPLSALVNLVKNGWSNISNFVGTAVSVYTSLVRSGWSSISSFVGTSVGVYTSLIRSGWSSIASFVGTSVSVATRLSKWNWSSIESYVGDDVTVWTRLAKWGWSNISDYVGDYMTTWVALRKSGWSSIADFVGTKVTTTVSLVVDKVGRVSAAIAKALGLESGGVITAGGKLMRFASGGAIMKSGRASWWDGVRKYAAGTSNAHGTLFVAGESGPEVAGHINGRTEILNKSQLAQTMQAAVYNGMIAALRGVTIQMPAVATGAVVPYEVSALIAKSTADIRSTLNANSEDVIQTIISVAGQIVDAIRAQERRAPNGASGPTAQQMINEINRRTQMFSASPIKGV